MRQQSAKTVTIALPLVLKCLQLLVLQHWRCPLDISCLVVQNTLSTHAGLGVQAKNNPGLLLWATFSLHCVLLCSASTKCKDMHCTRSRKLSLQSHQDVVEPYKLSMKLYTHNFIDMQGLQHAKLFDRLLSFSNKLHIYEEGNESQNGHCAVSLPSFATTAKNVLYVRKVI